MATLQELESAFCGDIDMDLGEADRNQGPPAASRVSPASLEDDDAVLRKAFEAENGAKLALLWSGRVAGHQSPSEADMALCSILAFWVGPDARRIDRLFRQSGLMRPKWDEKHGASTYGEMTIEEVLKSKTEFFEHGHDESSSPGGSGNRGKLKGGELPEALSNAFAEDGQAFAVDGGGKLWRYQGGVYKPDGSAHMRRLVKKTLDAWGMTERWSRRVAEEAEAYVAADAPTLWERPPQDVVNVANGLLNVETLDLIPHTPDFLSPVQLPVKYDIEAACPEWERFVSEVFPSDCQDLPFEIAAWLMTPNTSIQKAVLLYGQGGNGKSIFLEGMTAFLGRDNVSNKSLHSLQSDRFSVASLIGRLANICTDLPSEHLQGTDVFKKLVGFDRLPAEYKHKQSFEFSPYARLLFSANYLPRSKDSSDGFFDRWLVVPFETAVRGTAKEIGREELLGRLSRPGELGGVLNRALELLPRIRERNALTESRSMRQAREEFRATTDPFTVWLASNTTVGGESYVPKSDLALAYARHAERHGLPTMTTTALTQSIQKIHPQIDIKQRIVRGKREWCYMGLGLLEDDQR